VGVHLGEASFSELTSFLKMNALCQFIGTACLFVLVAVRVVNLEAFAVASVARHIVARNQRVSLTNGHNSLQN